MKFNIMERKNNAVIPDAMFKLCGMENAEKLLMVQMDGGLLMMPERNGVYRLLMLADALNDQACELLEAVAEECGPAEDDGEAALEDILGELEICLPDWALESAGIAKSAKLECNPDEESGEITLREASYRHNLLDVPYPILQYFLEVGCDLYALNEMLVAESQEKDDAK